MKERIDEYQDNLIKKLQNEIKSESVSEFNRFRLFLLANQIKSQNYGKNFGKVSNS